MRKKDAYLVELGNRIKVLRQNKGLKVRELGLLCSIDYSNLSRIENGQKSSRILTLKIIAKMLDADIKDIV